ncbi:MAG: sulfatase [Bryobacteraceae bacterium]
MRSQTRRSFLGTLAAPLAASSARRPNVVFILADDLGWRDTSLYGSRYYETPNIDKLAARGMMFRNAYAASPLCSPTRSSIMTGLYPARTGITIPVCHLPEVVLEQKLAARGRPDQKALIPNSVTRLKLEYFTLAEAFKQAGYRTAHFGKWHLGHEPYDPLHQGFDVDLPHTPGPGPVGGYLGGPWKFWPSEGAPGEHIEDRLAEEASRFVRENRDRPFYLNYWPFSVHSPWQAKPALIEKYKRKLDPRNPQRNPIYAAMVESLDTAVGRVLRALDENGLARDTIVVFTSDNGGVFWAPGERGMLQPGYGDVPITSNLPLRAGKASVYEGGTREPAVVVWPGRVKPGSASDAVIQSVDYYPTLLEMAGIRAEPAQKFDGISFVPALEGKPLGRQAIFCHFPHYTPAANNVPGTYVRKGGWKLIRFWCDNPDQTDRFELYDLENDAGEAHDLAAKYPEKVKELNALMERFLRDTNAVVPKPNPAYRPAKL